MSNYTYAKHTKKTFHTYGRHNSCPFSRRCFSDSGICGYIGYYLECPLTLEDKIHAQIREGVYEGVDPYSLFRAVRKGVRE